MDGLFEKIIFFSQAKAGISSTVTFLKALNAFEEEKDFSVLSGICHSLKQLSSLLAYSSCYEQYSTYIIHFLQKIFAFVDWTPKSDESKLF